MSKTINSRLTGKITILVVVVLVGSVSASGKVIYVDVNAPGADDGTSWENAYNYLQDALADAGSAVKPIEIRVAQGTYKTDSNSTDPNVSGNRTATFRLISGIEIKGGYAGYHAPESNVRHVDVYESVLSGDLNGDDGPSFTNYSENAYHIVTGDGNDPNTVLDGFSITGGNANGNEPYDRGAGIFADGVYLTVKNCKFTYNTAITNSGAFGIFNGAIVKIDSCLFAHNTSVRGGSTQIINATAHFNNCIFKNNSVLPNNGNPRPGGAIYNYGVVLTVSDCIFIANSSPWGAAIYHYPSGESQQSLLVTNSVFIGNIDMKPAFGLYSAGAGIYVESGHYADVLNCTFTENTAQYGAAIYVYRGSMTLTNSILWNDQASSSGNEIYNTGSITVSYCDVKGGWPGTGNINADPYFVDAAGGDLRLSAVSPCIDKGINAVVPLGMTTDFDGHPRIVDGDCNDTEIVDMGAYEFNYAYMGDLDYNCSVDFFDFSIFGKAWMTQQGDSGWDWTCDLSDPTNDYIDWHDVAIICDNWLAQIP